MNKAGWDAVKGRIDYSMLSKEQMKALKNAGISKKHLRNSEDAVKIFGALLNPSKCKSMKRK